MPHLRLLVVSSFTLCSVPALAAPASLCEPSEKIVFSCSFKNGKTVSVCSTEKRAAVYRFGKAGKVELAQPKEGSGKGWFTLQRTVGAYGATGYRELNDTSFSFAIGDFEYSITKRIWTEDGPEPAFLTVKKKSTYKALLSLTCSANEVVAWEVVDPACAGKQECLVE